MEVFREDHDIIAGGKIDIKNELVLDAINSALESVTDFDSLTPYIAWERVSKVLATYHIPLHKVFLEGPIGNEVISLSQFGDKIGMTNDGQMVVNNESNLFLYFEWQLSEVGKYTVYAEVVHEDDLHELLKDYESELSESYNKKELKMGEKDEKEEHGFSDKVAEKTAKDHLRKVDPHYYTKLKKVGLEEMKKNNEDKAPFDNPTEKPSTPYKKPGNKAKQLARSAMKKAMTSDKAFSKLSQKQQDRVNAKLRLQKEERLDEISKEYLKKALKSALKDRKALKKNSNKPSDSGWRTGDVDRQSGAYDDSEKLRSYETWREEKETINEISKKLMVNYMTKADKEVKGIEKKFKKGTDTPDDDKKLTRRVNGMNIARDKFYMRAKVPASGKDKAYSAAQAHYKAKGKIAEETINEVSKKLLQRYKKKADAQAEPLSKKYRKGTISDKEEKTLSKRGMGSSLAMQKLSGYGKPKVLAKEETGDVLDKGLKRTDLGLSDKLNKKGKLSKHTQKWMKTLAHGSGTLYSRELGKPKGHLPEENINEISTGLARNYLKKNAASKKKAEAEFYKADWVDLKNKREGTGQPAKSAKNAKKAIKTLTKRAKGETMAKNKLLGTAKVLTKEETINEISKATVERAYAKARDKGQHLDSIAIAGHQLDKDNSFSKKFRAKAEKKWTQARKFADYADKKTVKEETIDEVIDNEKIDDKAPGVKKLKNGSYWAKSESGTIKIFKSEKAAKQHSKKQLNELTYQKVRNAYDKAKKQGKHEKAAKFKKYSEKKDELQARYDDLEYKGD